MSARRHIAARLARSAPGDRQRQVRPLAARLTKRERVDTPKRVEPGDSLRVRDAIHTVRHRLVHPGPNAPLLIRLVRYPFVLEKVRAQRVPSPDRSALVRPERAPTEPALMVWAQARGPLLLGNPLRTTLAFEPTRRPSHPMLARALRVPSGFGGVE